MNLSRKAVFFILPVFIILGLCFYFLLGRKQLVENQSRKAPPQTEKKETLAKQIEFTKVEFPFVQVKRGENLEINCQYENTLGFSPQARVEIVLYEIEDKVKAVIFSRDFGEITQGRGTIMISFSIPRKISPGKYKAILNVYTKPEDVLKGGCSTDRFELI